MLRSGWGANLATGLALFLALVLVLFMAALAAIDLPPIYYHPEDQTAAVHGDDAREAEDTKAQVWMAWAAWVQVFISVLGFVGIGATVVFAALAWREAQRGANASIRAANAAIKANRDARDFFVAERRAWLAITPKVTKWEELPEGGIRLFVKVKAENVGLTPAFSVYFDVADDAIRHFISRQTIWDMVFEHDRTPNLPVFSQVGDAIFPGKHQTRTSWVSFKDGSPPSGQCYIPIVVSYRFEGSDDTHVSPVVWHVGFNAAATNKSRTDWQIAHYMTVPPN